MSLNRLAIIAAIGTHNTMKNRSDDIRWNKPHTVEQHERPQENSFNADVNVLLGGAMFSVVVSMVCFLCYCCHRSLKRRDMLYQQRWVHVDPNMDIYSVEQYYDISANNGIDEDQYAQIMRNHGPPPSYEIAVAMKSPVKTDMCHLCQVSSNCRCDSFKSVKEDEENKTVDVVAAKRTADQVLDVKNISQNENRHFYNHKSANQLRQTCDMCNEVLTSKNNNLCNEDIENGNTQRQCTNSCKYIQSCRVCGKHIHALPETSDDHDINDNVPSTSTDGNCCNNVDLNCNYEESEDGESDEEAEFDSLNENGLIRVDMRKLIDDQTGLPTYEAALKLESSGYV